MFLEMGKEWKWAKIKGYINNQSYIKNQTYIPHPPKLINFEIMLFGNGSIILIPFYNLGKLSKTTR